jgi:hypothetical protein
MKNQFDELARGLAQSTTRRQALKKFGLGLAGMALACFGLAKRAEAEKGPCLAEGEHCFGNGSVCCSRHCDWFPCNDPSGCQGGYWACGKKPHRA